jgi:uncharacterized membrane protein
VYINRKNKLKKSFIPPPNIEKMHCRNKYNKLLIILLIFILLATFATALFSEEQGLRDKIIHSLSKKGIHPGIAVIIISTLPVFELRGGIPVGINLFKMKWFFVVPLAILGNMIPVVPLLLFLGPLSRLLSRIKPFRIFFDWLFKRTKSRSTIVERYKSIGLMLFVAIPLPITGAWTGSIAAFLFNVRLSHALLSIFLGVIIASVIVTTLSMLGIWGAILAGAALITLGILSLLHSIQDKEEG